MKKKKVRKYIPTREEKKLIKELGKIVSISSRVSNSAFKTKKYLDNYGIKEDKSLIKFNELSELINVQHAYEEELATTLQAIRRKLQEDEEVREMRKEEN